MVIIGKQDSVLDAKREILKRFQTQSSSAVEIPKEYHGFILGKGGVKLKELEKQTATKITIPKETESSGRIVVSGPKEGMKLFLRQITVAPVCYILCFFQVLKKPSMKFR
jgi:hypothetical protein